MLLEAELWRASEAWVVVRTEISDEAWAVFGPLFLVPEATGRPPKALARVEVERNRRGKVAGIHAGTGVDAARRAAQGFTLINSTRDLEVLVQGVTAGLAAARLTSSIQNTESSNA
ncbi:hypothetical protein [Kocuria sabuli]|uniref:hypothetical protein n=1 Tax=Kocuria sabuli TaxID=3071448 RepID=UPI0034D646D2